MIDRPERLRKTKIVNKYEGLFILNLAGKEEGLNEVVERLQADLTGLA